MQPTNALEAVTQFIETFDASKDPLLWEALIAEEAKEFTEAYVNAMKEAMDLIYVISGYLAVTDEDSEGAAEIVNDNLHRNVQAFHVALTSHPLFGQLFLEVHRSNMSKLGEDGKPIKREDGKILKGPNYSPADLLPILINGTRTNH
jgi:hypothetical protein